MLYAAFAALLLSQASGTPVTSSARRAGPGVHLGRDLLTKNLSHSHSKHGEMTESAPASASYSDCVKQLPEWLCEKLHEHKSGSTPTASETPPLHQMQPPPPPGPCGSGGQPVCSGDQLSDREFECDYGFIGEDELCVPYPGTQGTKISDPAPIPTSIPTSAPTPIPSPVFATSSVPTPPPPAPAPIPTPPPPPPPPPPTPPAPTPPPSPPPPPPPAPTPSPPTSPAPSKGGFEFNGELTYYGGAGAGGACTQTWVPPGFTTVALNSGQYEAQNECGTCVYACFDNLELGQGERCFSAIIDNKCPECAWGDLDLGENGSGRWPVDWKKIPCPTDGTLIFSKQGSNASYAKVKAEGGAASVTSMICNGMEGKGTPDGYFEFNDTGNQNLDQGMECTVTFSNGESASQSGV